jgi:hypothetical protein
MRHFLIALSLLCSACTTGYNVSDENVQFVTWNEGHGKVVELMEQADPKAFKELSDYYGKDKNNVYWRSIIVEGADPATFKIINNHYGVDANHGVVREHVVKSSHGPTFTYLGNNWAKDKRDYFYSDSPLNVCDYASFTIIESSLMETAKDNQCYYTYGDKVPVKHFDSLQLLGGSYAKDRYQVYWLNRVLEKADATSFEVGESGHIARDKQQCFSGPAVISCNELSEDGQAFCRCN